MSLVQRNGFPWSVNECLQLQREYELLELSIDEIATKHKRTPKAIMFKLDKEGFADYSTLSNYYNSSHYKNTVNKEDEQLFETQLEDDDTEDDDEEGDEEDKEEEEEDEEEDENPISSIKKQLGDLNTKLEEFMEQILKHTKTPVPATTFKLFG